MLLLVLLGLHVPAVRKQKRRVINIYSSPSMTDEKITADVVTQSSNTDVLPFPVLDLQSWCRTAGLAVYYEVVQVDVKHMRMRLAICVCGRYGRRASVILNFRTRWI
jgi:hypothetical protein